ncbi:MAG: hypothetical protein J7M18_07945 [Candidatus Eremiobacteraeota bacterium]|nr:hypothetical protein [Candidatus Eremiobacteraeota bacterium]
MLIVSDLKRGAKTGIFTDWRFAHTINQTYDMAVLLIEKTEVDDRKKNSIVPGLYNIKKYLKNGRYLAYIKELKELLRGL